MHNYMVLKWTQKMLRSLAQYLLSKPECVLRMMRFQGLKYSFQHRRASVSQYSRTRKSTTVWNLGFSRHKPQRQSVEKLLVRTNCTGEWAQGLNLDIYQCNRPNKVRTVKLLHEGYFKPAFWLRISSPKRDHSDILMLVKGSCRQVELAGGY